MVLLQEIVRTQIDVVWPGISLCGFLRHKGLQANHALQPEDSANALQTHFWGGVGFGGVAVDGRGRVDDGAAGTAGAGTPEEAL